MTSTVKSDNRPAASTFSRRIFFSKIVRRENIIGWLFVPYTVLMLTNLLGMSGDPDRMGVVESILLAATGIIALAVMVDLGFRRGTPGDNQFGPDPRQGRV